MSKLSFRARALDASKPMPIYMAEELPDLPDYSAINRAVPQMPSGMEKEEECEHHLQRAICTGLIIPTPEVADMADAEAYDKIYPIDAKLPRQLIHMQPFAMEQDIPDYDMDSEDERWVTLQTKKMDIDALKFEEMMDRLEKGSGQTVVTLQEAKSLLKEDDDLIIAVYDYWLNKRLKTQHPLILAVKTEHRLGTAANNPYLAFRRRTEKMQTRKNRKNDETSYEKMLKLRRDLQRAVTLLELAKRREKTKREHFHLTIEVFEKRYQCGDFSGQLLAEVSALKVQRPAFAPLFANQFGINHQNWPAKSKEEVGRKEKRQYRKRKHKGCATSLRAAGSRDVLSSEDDAEPASAAAAAAAAGGQADTDADDTDASDEPFAFRRRIDCNYHAPLPLTEPGNWPWCSRAEGGAGDVRYRFCVTSVSAPGGGRRCVGLARRRVGRGGRVVLDRVGADPLAALDFTVRETPAKDATAAGVNDWLHFRPRTPPTSSSDSDDSDRVDSLRAIFAPDATLAVEPPSDETLFEPTVSSFNLYDFLSTPPTLDYQLGGNYLEENPIVERLGHVKDELEDCGFEPYELQCETVRTEPSGGKVGAGEFGCSTFTIRPMVDRRDRRSRGETIVAEKSCAVATAPEVTSVLANKAVRQPRPVANHVARPVANRSVHCGDHGYSNGGLVPKKEPSVGANATADVHRTAAGFALPNGPTAASAEYADKQPWAAVTSAHNYAAVRGSPQHRPSSVSGGNYVIGLGRAIKHEPVDETAINSDPVDVEATEKASNQVCVDKKQLVRKNNSLPMEVT